MWKTMFFCRTNPPISDFSFPFCENLEPEKNHGSYWAGIQKIEKKFTRVSIWSKRRDQARRKERGSSTWAGGRDTISLREAGRKEARSWSPSTAPEKIEILNLKTF
jgi:hypothetical protein